MAHRKNKIPAQLVEDEDYQLRHERVAGIDIAKATADVCNRLPPVRDGGRRVSRVEQQIPATARDVLALDGVELVVMESTSDYWRLWYYLLESLGLAVALVDEASPATHALNYSDVMELRDGMAPEDEGDRLLITTEVPLRDFAVLLLGNDALGDDLIFIPRDSFGEIDELAPGEGFVIEHFRAHGMMPASGVTFVDEDGAQRYFALWQTQSGFGEPYYLVEFENRMDELPDDWQPWW